MITQLKKKDNRKNSEGGDFGGQGSAPPPPFPLKISHPIPPITAVFKKSHLPLTFMNGGERGGGGWSGAFGL